MTLAEFKKILDATGYAVAYSHFSGPQKPPFICYLVDDEPNLITDNKVYHKILDVTIELYTKTKDLKAEAKLETLLDQHEIPYQPYQTFIESENVYQKIYEVRLI